MEDTAWGHAQLSPYWRSENLSCNRNAISARGWKEALTFVLTLFSRKQDGCRYEGEAILVEERRWKRESYSLSCKFQSLLKWNMRTSTSMHKKVKQHEAAREGINSANLKISSLSMQIRLSGWEICSQTEVSFLFHHFVGCYHPKKLKIESLRTWSHIWCRG